MKIVKIEESKKDSLEITELIKQREIYQNAVNRYTARIRELIYKYDTAKMDYTKDAKK
jgi:hypothetical protein